MDEVHVGFEEAVGYMRPNWEAIRNNGFSASSLLDIGACQAHFADFFRTVYPKASVTCIECNERNAEYLKGYQTHLVCLGSEPCIRTFFVNPKELHGGGSTFYRETTAAFTDPVEEEKQIVTLDSLNLGSFDVIKLDTQGSELDIIRGGEETIKKACLVQIECSFVDYNEGGCLIDDVIAQMRAYGFRMLDTFGPACGGHWWNYQKVQVDVIFAKENEPILRMLR